jgi:hypothetical protein
VSLLWGGYSVGNPTLNRFFALHYLLPFMTVGVVVLHVWALHVVGQNNPTGVPVKSGKDAVPFTPYATIKDLFATIIFIMFFAWWVFFLPNYLGHADNYIPANPAVTPAHIVPEWYFCRSTRSCAPFRTSSAASWRCSGRSSFLRSSLARHVARAVRKLPTALPSVLLALRRRLRPAWVARRQAGRRRVRDRHPFRHGLVLHPLPGCAPTARAFRNAQAPALLDRRNGSRETRRGRDAGRRGGRTADPRLSGIETSGLTSR